jgi:cell division protein FtsB
VKKTRSRPVLAKKSTTEGLALFVLLGLAAFCLAGPSGLLAWSENRQLLEQRQKEQKELTVVLAQLRNRVNLLSPHNTDPDLAGELLRKDLNVVHEDDMVIQLGK